MCGACIVLISRREGCGVPLVHEIKILMGYIYYKYMTGYDGSRDTELATRGSEFSREGRRPLFQWDVRISVGFSTELRLQVPYVIPRPGVPRYISYFLKAVFHTFVYKSYEPYNLFLLILYSILINIINFIIFFSTGLKSGN